MRNILILILLTLSVNSYANNHYKVTTILVEKNVRLPLQFNHYDVPSTTGNATTTASAHAAAGATNQVITAKGDVYYYIYNSSNVQQGYFVDKYMCVDTMYCTHIRDTVVLDPKATIETSQTISTDVQFMDTGVHEDETIIQISGVDTSFSESTNKLTVS